MSASHMLKILLCFVMGPPQLNRSPFNEIHKKPADFLSLSNTAFDHPTNLKMILCNLCTFPDKPKFRFNHKRTPLLSPAEKTGH